MRKRSCGVSRPRSATALSRSLGFLQHPHGQAARETELVQGGDSRVRHQRRPFERALEQRLVLRQLIARPSGTGLPGEAQRQQRRDGTTAAEPEAAPARAASAALDVVETKAEKRRRQLVLDSLLAVAVESGCGCHRLGAPVDQLVLPQPEAQCRREALARGAAGLAVHDDRNHPVRLT